MIKSIMEQHEELRKYLFIRGFLITNDKEISADGFPFYNSWHKTDLNGMCFWTHPLTGFHFYENNGATFFLLGHTYNPFTMEINENTILERIAAHYNQKDFYDFVDEITGIFVFGIIENGNLLYLTDPAGIQSSCYGIINNKFYLSSHPQMLGDLCNLEMSDLAEELVNYKWYPRVMGSYMPADITKYDTVKRVVPNIEYIFSSKTTSISHKRFYPLKDLQECKNEEEYQAVIKEAADILKNNMELVSKKWNNPWISLTGGIDSNATFAAANGIYDKFKTFSYMSAEKETIDCDAAEKISKAFNIPWTLYKIPETADNLKNYNEIAEIIRHNNGYIAKEKDNELRKRVYLMENLPADVEVKSWVSETIRAYWYKHYGRKNMPKLSANCIETFTKFLF